MNRREFISGTSTSLLLLSSPFRLSANVNTKGKKLIWIVLRGGLDSLHALVPTFEPELTKLRPSLLKQELTKLLPLTQGFALHPSLAHLHQLYQSNQLLPVVAVSSGYNKRSHFDAQDFIEAGTGQLTQKSGWLARASNTSNTKGIAIAKTLPLSMRGAEHASTWYPSKLNASEQDTYQAMLAMYQQAPDFADNLASALEHRALASGANKKASEFVQLAHSCAQLLNSEQQLDSAVLELNGWDTHNKQDQRLSRKLSELDQGIATLQQQLGDNWDNTVIAISTEFGRTIKENGSRGTDHGSASCLMFAGGAVKGGNILGKWPGLKPEQQHQNRDLAGTSLLFDWLASATQQHWQLSAQQVRQIFPSANLLNIELVKS